MVNITFSGRIGMSENLKNGSSALNVVVEDGIVPRRRLRLSQRAQPLLQRVGAQAGAETKSSVL